MSRDSDSFDGGRKDAGAIVTDEDASAGGGGSSGTTSSSGNGSTGCAPGAACGGLYECEDRCYGEDCCFLSCTCTDPTGQNGALQCALQCN